MSRKELVDKKDAEFGCGTYELAQDIISVYIVIAANHVIPDVISMCVLNQKH